MTMHITCPNCQQSLQLPDGLGGKPVKCRGCFQQFTVPMTPTFNDVNAPPAPRREPPGPRRRPKPRREGTSVLILVIVFIILGGGFIMAIAGTILVAMALMPTQQPPTTTHTTRTNNVKHPPPRPPVKKFPPTNIVAIRASHSDRRATPEKAIDGDPETKWNANRWPPAWIEADLGRKRRLKKLTLVVSQLPDGPTTHEVWISDHPIGANRDKARLITTLSGFTRRGQILHHNFPAGTHARFVQIHTKETRSWVSWAEIHVEVE